MQSSPSRNQWIGIVVLTLVVLAAAWQTTRAYLRFRDDHRGLWVHALHDRTEHQYYALRIASALRQGRVHEVVGLFVEAAIWPPLHGMLAGATMAAGGMDHRIAILPNLCAWFGSAVLAYLLAWRCLPVGGAWGGLVAASFLLASPAHHGFAVDIMLESVGAFLTLLCLYLYVRIVQEGAVFHFRCLALALTAMVLHKYNYWVLVVLALLTSEVLSRGLMYLSWLRETGAGVDWRSLLRREFRHPLWWTFVAILGLAAAIVWRGPRPLVVFGLSVNIHPPGNILNAAFAVVVLRIVLAGRPWSATLERIDPRARQFLLWHLLPVGLFFLLPRHLSSFLWYVSPANGPRGTGLPLLAGARFYAAQAIEHYHVSFLAAVLAVSFFAIALLCLHRLRPGAVAVLCLGLIAAVLTSMHPNHQARYLHSWIAVIWVGAGIGVVAPLVFVRSRAKLGVVLAGCAALGMLWVLSPAMFAAHRSWMAGPNPALPSLLPIAQTVVRESASSTRFTVLCAVPSQAVLKCALLEDQGDLERFEDHRHGFAKGTEANRAAFTHWLASTACDTIFYLERMDPLPACPLERGEVQVHYEIRDLLASGERFLLQDVRAYPEHHCRLCIYRRTDRTPETSSGNDSLTRTPPPLLTIPWLGSR